MALTRRKLMRLCAAGLSSAAVPLQALYAGCAKQVGQPHGSKHFPTPDDPFTPTADWYFMSITGSYEADRASYRLKVSGLVDQELSLSVDALRAEFPLAEEMVTLSCVGNTPDGLLRSSAWFRGVRMRDVIARAGAPARASGAWVTGLDGFAALQSIDDLMRNESLLALDLGPSREAYTPLTIDLGFPCRLLVPGLYGYMNTKWIDAITFVDQSGYQDVLASSFKYLEGRVQLASGFSWPIGGVSMPGGKLGVLGYAFGDGRAIAKVELSIDRGPWQPTAIAWNDHTDPSDDKPSYLWTLWAYLWDAPPGEHELRCRATYADGETQQEGMAFPYSGGSIASLPVTITAAGA